MKRLSTLVLALTAASVLGIGAANASAEELPELKVLSGETFPVTAEGATKKQAEGAAIIESASGSKLSSEELKISLEQTTSGASGSIHLRFAGVTEGKTKCNTEGDSEGVVLIAGEYHLVSAGTNEELGLLVSFTELSVLCGKVKVKVAGPLMMHTRKINATGDFESFTIVSHCAGKGKQDLTSYLNDEGKSVEKQLLKANFGLGAENACMEVKEEPVIKVSKMVSLNKSGSISLLMSPWKVKISAYLIFFAKNEGSRIVRNITVNFTSLAFTQETAGVADPCEGAPLMLIAETCEVKLKCVGTEGAEGPIEVRTPTWWVADGKGTLKCVA